MPGWGESGWGEETWGPVGGGQAPLVLTKPPSFGPPGIFEPSKPAHSLPPDGDEGMRLIRYQEQLRRLPRLRSNHAATASAKKNPAKRADPGIGPAHPKAGYR